MERKEMNGKIIGIISILSVLIGIWIIYSMTGERLISRRLIAHLENKYNEEFKVDEYLGMKYGKSGGMSCDGVEIWESKTDENKRYYNYIVYSKDSKKYFEATVFKNKSIVEFSDKYN